MYPPLSWVAPKGLPSAIAMGDNAMPAPNAVATAMESVFLDVLSFIQNFLKDTVNHACLNNAFPNGMLPRVTQTVNVTPLF
jgi:hypothetical protein